MSHRMSRYLTSSVRYFPRPANEMPCIHNSVVARVDGSYETIGDTRWIRWWRVLLVTWHAEWIVGLQTSTWSRARVEVISVPKRKMSRPPMLRLSQKAKERNRVLWRKILLKTSFNVEQYCEDLDWMTHTTRFWQLTKVTLLDIFRIRCFIDFLLKRVTPRMSQGSCTFRYPSDNLNSLVAKHFSSFHFTFLRWFSLSYLVLHEPLLHRCIQWAAMDRRKKLPPYQTPVTQDMTEEEITIIDWVFK